MAEKEFVIKKSQSANKTIRMPDDLIEQLQALANKNDISFNQVVIQCCQYALDNLESDQKNK
ncbi:MAG: hypothetical protein IJN42_00640 [Clostridia bacterium]|nr:hypothetical protein [Clostridia bacterium]